MKAPLLITILFVITNFAVAQNKDFEFVELGYGIAKVKEGTEVKLKNSPSGSRGILSEYEITKNTDSIQIEPKANFGVLYIIKSAKDVDIDIEIEWIYPEKIKSENGKKIKSLKYLMPRPTNTETASSYSLDTPEEMVQGEWTINIYLKGKQVHSRKFILYK